MTNSFRLGTDGIYRCDAFQQFVWQEHGFGTREANPKVDITLRQVHSNRVVYANGLHDREEEGDALITDHTGQSIGIRTADCVPILLLDSKNRAIAAVHAGWRGTASEIVKTVVVAMNERFRSEPADIYAAMGPSIRPCCYEVGEDVAAKFSALFPEWGIENEGMKVRLDLVEANRRHLKSAGVEDDRIFDSGLCTTCDGGQFFSYRREPENPGRMLASITRLA
ncbi:MAG: peptidoglycan editing factor PgeF [Acidobacteriota bacterium]|nr:peptidoglycan editing factor PgeF [Acidobacteriota bacterium]